MIVIALYSPMLPLEKGAGEGLHSQEAWCDVQFHQYSLGWIFKNPSLMKDSSGGSTDVRNVMFQAGMAPIRFPFSFTRSPSLLGRSRWLYSRACLRSYPRVVVGYCQSEAAPVEDIGIF